MRVRDRHEVALTDVDGSAGDRRDRRRAAAFAQQRDLGVDPVLAEDAEFLRVEGLGVDVLSGVGDADGRQAGDVRTLDGGRREDDRGR